MTFKGALILPIKLSKTTKLEEKKKKRVLKLEETVEIYIVNWFNLFLEHILLICNNSGSMVHCF